MKHLQIILLLTHVFLIFCQKPTTTSTSSSSPSSSPSSSASSSSPLISPTTQSTTSGNSSTSTQDETSNESNNHESRKKVIQSEVNGTSQPSVIIHYVNFNLTENYNRSNEYYVQTSDSPLSVNNTDSLTSSTNGTLIEKSKKMLHRVYNKITSFTDSLDTNILSTLWFPFLVGFSAGLTLLCLFYSSRFLLRRCCCCRRYRRKRNPKKIQSLTDNQYLLVSNQSDSEGV